MRESRSLFELPSPTGTDNRFDHRLAISAYLYTLTVRLGILASVGPSFRTRAHVRAELRDHAIRLAQICDEADAKIAPASGAQRQTAISGGNPSAATFSVAS